jgi:hypothetical protein
LKDFKFEQAMYCVVRCPNNHLSVALFRSKTHTCPVCNTAFALRPRGERRILFSSHDVEQCRGYMLKTRRARQNF